MNQSMLDLVGPTFKISCTVLVNDSTTIGGKNRCQCAETTRNAVRHAILTHAADSDFVVDERNVN